MFVSSVINARFSLDGVQQSFADEFFILEVSIPLQLDSLTTFVDPQKFRLDKLPFNAHGFVSRVHRSAVVEEDVAMGRLTILQLLDHAVADNQLHFIDAGSVSGELDLKRGNQGQVRIAGS